MAQFFGHKDKQNFVQVEGVNDTRLIVNALDL